MVDRGFDEAAGRHLVQALDHAHFPVTGALWLSNPEYGGWKLLIVSPLVNQRNLNQTYSRVHDIARKLPEFPLLLSAISLVEPKNPLIRLLRTAIRTDPKAIAGIRFSRNVINGTYIDDAFIYRLAA